MGPTWRGRGSAACSGLGAVALSAVLVVAALTAVAATATSQTLVAGARPSGVAAQTMAPTAPPGGSGYPVLASRGGAGLWFTSRAGPVTGGGAISGCIAYMGDPHISTSPQSRGDIKVGGGIAGCRGQVSFVYVTVALYKTGDGTSHLVQKTSCSSSGPKTTCTWSSYATPNDRYPPTVPSGSYFFNQNSHVACQYRRGINTTSDLEVVRPPETAPATQRGNPDGIRARGRC